MIGFSLVASLVLTTAALGLVARASNVGAQDDGNPTA